MDKPVDTVQTPAPQPGQDADAGVKFELVDTPEGTPEGGGTAVNAQPQPAPQDKLFLDKYRTEDDARTAMKEAERKMHEATQKAAAYEKMLMERANAPTPPQHSQPQDYDEALREPLAEKPATTIFKMINDVFEYREQQKLSMNRQTMARFQEFASRPGYAEVANEAAQQIPFAEPVEPVEGAFLRARIAKLEQALAARGGAPVAPMHVESGNGSRPAGNVLRVELQDAGKARTIFGDRTEELAKTAARMQTFDPDGRKKAWNIDEWSAVKGQKNA